MYRRFELAVRQQEKPLFAVIYRPVHSRFGNRAAAALVCTLFVEGEFAYLPRVTFAHGLCHTLCKRRSVLHRKVDHSAVCQSLFDMRKGLRVLVHKKSEIVDAPVGVEFNKVILEFGGILDDFHYTVLRNYFSNLILSQLPFIVNITNTAVLDSEFIQKPLYHFRKPPDVQTVNKRVMRLNRQRH